MTAESKRETNRKPTVLVAGGAGFIGAHLCKILVEDGYQVFCLDNLSTGSKENIKELLTKSNFHFLEADITQNLDVVSQVGKLDAIYHLSSLEALKTKDFSLETLLVNSIGTRNLLELAARSKAKFVLVSSADIYQGSFSSNSFQNFFGSSGEEALMSENEAKRFAEALTVEYFKKYQLLANIVRVKDVYGPLMNFGVESDLTTLIREAKEGRNLSVKGDGLKVLNPTFVSDVVFGLTKVLQSDHQGEIFNLVSDEKTTVLGVAETLRLVVGNLEIEQDKTESSLEFPPSPVDLEVTRSKLKWNPRVSLAEGISSTLQSFAPVAPARMVELAPEVKEVAAPKKQKRTRSLLRLSIFVISLALVCLTTLVPFGVFSWETNQAVNKLSSGYTNFEEGRISSASDFLASSLSHTQAAEKNLNNLRWLLQLAGQRQQLKAHENLLFATEDLANSLTLLSQVSTAVSTAEKIEDVGKAKEYLQVANQYLVEAFQDLDLAKTNLEASEEKKLYPTVAKNYSQLISLLDKETQRAESIREPLEQTLKNLEGSTVP